jgi:hypothetical protein
MKKSNNGLTPAQRKLPEKLQNAILNSKKNKKSKSKDDYNDDHEINKEKADLDGDGKLSSYEKKRGKAIQKAMKEKDCDCEGDCDCKKDEVYKKSLPTFQEWLKWRESK